MSYNLSPSWSRWIPKVRVSENGPTKKAGRAVLVLKENKNCEPWRRSSKAEPGAVLEDRDRKEEQVLETRFLAHEERIHGAHGSRMQSLFIISQTCWKSRDRYRCRARTARRSCEFLAPVHAKGRKEPTRPLVPSYSLLASCPRAHLRLNM